MSLLILLPLPIFSHVRVSGIEDCIPFESFGVDDEDEMTGERLSVPAGVYCNIPPMPLNRPSEISRYVITSYCRNSALIPARPQRFRLG